MFQRPHQLLRALALGGCRAIFHVAEGVDSAYSPGIYEPEPNLLVVVGEDPRRLIEGTFVTWCAYPPYVRQARKWQADLVVFDHIDAFSDEFSSMASQMPEAMAEADLVFAVSERLWQQARKRHSHAYLLPNGVDFDHFRQAAAAGPVPEDIRHLPRPVIGFYGTLSSWIDWDWIREAADRRPDWSFVLIGPQWQPGSGEAWRAGNNVHLLGPRKYQTLADYLRGFDVAMLPFRRTEMTMASDPIKLYEYSASGKPVVATAIPQAARVPGIRLVDTAAGFLAGLEAALAEPGDADVETRIAFARRNTWELRAQRVLEVIADVGAARGPIAAWVASAGRGSGSTGSSGRVFLPFDDDDDESHSGTSGSSSYPFPPCGSGDSDCDDPDSHTSGSGNDWSDSEYDHSGSESYASGSSDDDSGSGSDSSGSGSHGSGSGSDSSGSGGVRNG